MWAAVVHNFAQSLALEQEAAGVQEILLLWGHSVPADGTQPLSASRIPPFQFHARVAKGLCGWRMYDDFASRESLASGILQRLNQHILEMVSRHSLRMLLAQFRAVGSAFERLNGVRQGHGAVDVQGDSYSLHRSIQLELMLHSPQEWVNLIPHAHIPWVAQLQQPGHDGYVVSRRALARYGEGVDAPESIGETVERAHDHRLSGPCSIHLNTC
mmetsp:Transcript_17438/g.31002  ORF Transcript_17438/g.31002 Transcript_17438/m.31002 type:complete len:214 (-) Transcript_17438:1719-2360(-)